ncbi:cilia- and flagella-associated protein 97 [Clupea harengus]|uniref:Cilia- and flagella-associated protein 97 n=1 Tax=Clupea harengus TaxID=7950 RepID=A0A6P3VL58_CLUHA|nr:cilia- and flagella-associated protein 97 [Clupea harengus]
MYSPKELEGEVDHSFFDSDCDGEDGKNQDHDNAESKQQRSVSDVVSHGGRFSTELSIKARQKQDQLEEDKRGDDNSQVEDAFIDLKEIKSAISEVEDWNGGSASDAESIRRNEERNRAAGSDRGVDTSKNSSLVEASSVSSRMSCEQKAADETLVNDDGDETVEEMKKTNFEKGGGREIKKDRSVFPNASDQQDGSDIGGEDSGQEESQSRSLVGTGSLCSSVSSLPSGQEKNPAKAKHPRSRSPSDISTVSSEEERELEDLDDDDVLDNLDANEDGYQRSEESGCSDEERPPEPPPTKHKPQLLLGTPRKSSGKFRKHSPRPSSSSELESSCSSDGEGHSSSSDLSPPRRAPAALATSSPRRKLRLNSAPSRERAVLESEDTVTDVTPLSTPDMSPAQSFDLPVFVVKAKEPTAAPAWADENPKQHNVTIDLNVNANNSSKRDDSTEEDLGMETQEASSLNQNVTWEDPMDKPRDPDQEALSHVSSAREFGSISVGSTQGDIPGKHRRNFSFRNEDVWRIDRENQRLLRELSRPSRRSRSGSASSSHTMPSCGTRRASGPPPPLQYHSAVNRQREQKRIERENLALLKRLESVKPSKGITRSEQFADYQRQARYICTPLPTATIEHYHSKIASLSASSQGKSTRPNSAGVRLSPRPGSRPSPAPTKPSRSTTPRPAWS